MGQYKTVTDTITQWFEDNTTINEVTLGDINEVDLTTRTHFPLAHIIYLNNVLNDGYSTYNYQILALDTFFDNVDDKLVVLDEMNEVLATFVQSIYGGTLFNYQIRVDVAPLSEVMYDQLQNRLYGWSLTIGVNVPNGINVCI